MKHVRTIGDLATSGRILLFAQNAAEYNGLITELSVAGFEIAVTSATAEIASRIASFDPELMLLEAPPDNVELVRMVDRVQQDLQDRSVPLVLLSKPGRTVNRALAFGAGVRDILAMPLVREEAVAKLAYWVRTRQLSIALETTALQLVQASTMRDKLSTMIIHDLRSALSSLVLALEAADQPDDLLELPPETLQLANAQLRMAAELCDQLLYVGRLERNELVPAPYAANLHETVANAVGVLSPQAVVREVVLAVDVPDLPVDIDHHLLGRIVLNLTSNAIKASNPGDSVAVVAEVGPTEFRITVRDSGPGIPQELQAGIFDLYSKQGDYAATQSAGIGLAFCKLATEAMGGQISLVSTMGAGSEFTVNLPLGK